MMYKYNNTFTNKTQILQILPSCQLQKTHKYTSMILIQFPETSLRIYNGTFNLGYVQVVDPAYTYDDISKHAFIYTSDYYIHAINCSDPNNMYLEPTKAGAYVIAQAMASNGTDVFVGGKAVDANHPSIIMVSFSDFLHPRTVDSIRNYGGWSPALYYYDGILYAGGGGSIEAIKVIPGTSSPPVNSVIPKKSTAKMPTPLPNETSTPASPLSAWQL